MSLKGEWLEWHFLEQKMTRKRRSFGSGFKAKVAVEEIIPILRERERCKELDRASAARRRAKKKIQ